MLAYVFMSAKYNLTNSQYTKTQYEYQKLNDLKVEHFNFIISEF